MAELADASECLRTTFESPPLRPTSLLLAEPQALLALILLLPLDLGLEGWVIAGHGLLRPVEAAELWVEDSARRTQGDVGRDHLLRRLLGWRGRERVRRRVRGRGQLMGAHVVHLLAVLQGLLRQVDRVLAVHPLLERRLELPVEGLVREELHRPRTSAARRGRLALDLGRGVRPGDLERGVRLAVPRRGHLLALAAALPRKPLAQLRGHLPSQGSLATFKQKAKGWSQNSCGDRTVLNEPTRMRCNRCCKRACHKSLLANKPARPRHQARGANRG
eukprot:11244787-Alexandrium_andersonii.AAC.1